MAYCTWKSYKFKADPLQVFEALQEQAHCFFLDSSLTADYSLGRYSFLGAGPFYILRTGNEEPFGKLREVLNNYKLSLPKINMPFTGGAVGYLSYDLGSFIEKNKRKKAAPDLEVPGSLFAFYNTIIIVDNFKKLVHIFAVGFPEKSYLLAKSLCQENIRKITKLLSAVKPRNDRRKKEKAGKSSEGLKSDFSKEEYLGAVSKAKRYIKAGDIYQVNLSQRFNTNTDLTSLEIYKNLRSLSPSFFSAYFDAGDFQILSSSPERFIRLEKNKAVTRPMKGTRPRGKNTKEDRVLKKELLNSQKDKAELTMIVDLERNDLGRVCAYDSIKVNVLRQLEAYSTVFQTTAVVSGNLHKDNDRIDLLRACFPGGSITGCPKIRAMEIIEELEPSRRAIYTGCLGYLSFSGDMDFNILIRTILKKENNLCFGVGAGIVADSEPEAEYQETLVKAKAIMQALNIRDTLIAKAKGVP